MVKGADLQLLHQSPFSDLPVSVYQQDGEGGRERDWDRQRGESERRFVGGREKEIGTDREERVREDLFGRN